MLEEFLRAFSAHDAGVARAYFGADAHVVYFGKDLSGKQIDQWLQDQFSDQGKVIAKGPVQLQVVNGNSHALEQVQLTSRSLVGGRGDQSVVTVIFDAQLADEGGTSKIARLTIIPSSETMPRATPPARTATVEDPSRASPFP